MTNSMAEAHPAVGSDDTTRQRVLEAAGPVFAEKGFEAASVREITKASRTSPAAVNYYFRSKEQLYVETVRYAGESCMARTPLPSWPAGTPAEVKLRDFITTFLLRILRPDVPAWHRQLLMREVSQPTAGACAAFVREFIRPTFGLLLAVLRELVPADVPPAKLHLLGGSIVGQCLHYHHARHVLPLLVGPDEYGSYDVDALAAHVYEFSRAALRGLYPERGAA